MTYWYWVCSTPQREDKVPQNKSANIFKGEWKAGKTDGKGQYSDMKG